MTAILFLAVLFVLILVHEWGHFIVAKLTKMRVDEFAIGFPPRVFGIKKGETLYSINLLPIGGFVKILGENYDEDENMSGADKARAFGARPRLAQAAVLLAGVTMNIVLAWLLFVIVFMIGVPTAVETASSLDAELQVAMVLKDSPADYAGITQGAVVTALYAGDDSLTELSPAAFTSFVTEHNGQTLKLSYKMNGENKEATLEPVTGILESDTEKPAVGVALALIENVSLSPLAAMKEASVTTVVTLKNITVGISNLLVGIFTSSADLSEVTGPIGIASMVGEAAKIGVTSLLMFTAFISLNLAVVNLLPIPALDGGRLIFVALEAIIRRPLHPVWLMRINMIGFVALILLMVVITVHDIVKVV